MKIVVTKESDIYNAYLSWDFGVHASWETPEKAVEYLRDVYSQSKSVLWEEIAMQYMKEPLFFWRNFKKISFVL